MLHLLCGRDEREIGGRILLSVVFADDVLTFFDESGHALTQFGLAFDAHEVEDLLQTFHLQFGVVCARCAGTPDYEK
jgi:hypothetical protein